MTGDADSSNAVLLEEPGFQNLEAAFELTAGAVDVTRDHQHLRDAGLADEPAEQVIERRRALNPARDDVGDRFHAFAAKPLRQPDGVPRVGAWHVRDVELGSSRNDVGIALDALRLASGGFDGKTLDEILNRLFVQ
jgi:hypothetical protein